MCKPPVTVSCVKLIKTVSVVGTMMVMMVMMMVRIMGSYGDRYLRNPPVTVAMTTE